MTTSVIVTCSRSPLVSRMIFSAKTVIIAVLLISLRSPAAPGHARGVCAIHYTPAASEPSRRVYFQELSGDESRLLQLRQRLIRAGAWHVNMFPPSHIVCMLPRRIDAGSVSGTCMAVEEAEMSAMSRHADPSSIDFYRRCYELAREVADPDSKPFIDKGETRPARSYRDTVLVASPYADPHRAAAAREPDADSAPAAQGREYYQNTEFMLGDIVVNIILPESSGYMNSEDWTDQRMNSAIQGAIAGLLTFQELYPHAAMDFTIRTFKAVPNLWEPITMTLDMHNRWINYAAYQIDQKYDQYGDSYPVIHQFNTDSRLYYNADWVFTIFIVSAFNAESHMFQGADYISYACFGGPYLVMPFPAGDIYFNPDESYRLAAYTQYETGHVFWALNENLYDKGDCNNKSGYLNHINANKVDDEFGGIAVNDCDGQPGPCVMRAPERFPGIICEHTAGHIGIIDEDENGVPDIFDSSPEIEFDGGQVETLLVDTVTVTGTVRSPAIPNRNSKQDSTTWIDYAVPLKDATMYVNGFGPLYLLPEDGTWDQLQERLFIPLSKLSMGLNRISLQVRNAAGFMSAPIEKDIFRTGLVYSLYSIDFANNGIQLSWYVIGETFNATFDLYRFTGEGDTADTTVVATSLQPAGQRENQFLPFSYLDTTVEPALTYTYFVRGTFNITLPGGVVRTLVNDSKPLKATAIIPMASNTLLSTLSPNPFQSSTHFSVKVPATMQDGSYQQSGNVRFAGMPGVAHEVPTHVSVNIYNVAGQLVKTLLDTDMYSTVLTLEWDGTAATSERLPSGIYFIQAAIGARSQARKVVILR